MKSRRSKKPVMAWKIYHADTTKPRESTKNAKPHIRERELLQSIRKFDALLNLELNYWELYKDYFETKTTGNPKKNTEQVNYARANERRIELLKQRAELIKVEFRKDFDRILADEPQAYRKVAYARLIEGKTYKQIQEEMKLTKEEMNEIAKAVRKEIENGLQTR